MKSFFRISTRHFLFACLLAIVLGGCGGGSGGNPETNPSQLAQEQEEPIRAGIIIVKPLMDIANVGLPYENSVRIVPNDSRNEVVSLSINNPTTGGAQPGIDSAGKVTWTANIIDFSSTTALNVTAKLKIGADVTVSAPVVVRNERVVYEVLLGPDDADYSDPDGRYRVRIERLNSSQPIVGTLQIVSDSRQFSTD